VAQGYIDDSGEPSKDMFVLAGFVSDEERWERFSDLWHKTLRNPPAIRYLKMWEANSLKKEFLNWEPKDRDRKIMQLVQVIRDHVAMRVSCAIKWADYNQVLRGRVQPRINDNPYFFLFYRTIANVIRFQIERNITEPVDFVFDRHGKIGKRALEWHDWTVKSRSPQLARFFGGPPIFRDDTKVLPLQAADMLAWQIRRQLSGDRRNTQEDSSCFDSLRQITGVHQNLTRQYLERVAFLARSGLANAMQARFVKIGRQRIAREGDAESEPDK
jgi:hypothetical protein